MSRFIDNYNNLLGKVLALILIFMTLLTTAVVFQRYGLNQGSIFQQELITYLHASLFMLGASYTLKQDAHVRVDIFYQYFNASQKAWVNCIGHLVFLLPMTGFIGLSSLDFVAQSWSLRETSAEPGGIPVVFILKTLIPALSLTLFLQGLIEFLHQARLLVFNSAEPPGTEQ